MEVGRTMLKSSYREEVTALYQYAHECVTMYHDSRCADELLAQSPVAGIAEGFTY